MRTAVDAQLAQVEAGTFRHEVLLCAKRFKSSWVELGQILVKVRDQGVWKTWGFPDFERYCSQELHLRRATVYKLTSSFSFLSRHEKSFPAQDTEKASPPPFEVVSVLAEAAERGQLTSEDYDELRETIWSPKD